MHLTVIGKHEKDKRACRDGYIQAMLEVMEHDPKVVHIDCDLMSCIGAGKLEKAFPARVINAGIAEANAVGVAAGLAATGKTVFVHSFGTFASRRAFDQAFMSAAYAGLPIHIIGSDPGITAAFNGGTHMPFEDGALYLSVPDAVVVDIADHAQLVSVTKQLAQSEQFSYLRTPRKDIITVYADGSEFEIGKGVTLREGNDVAIFASGILVDEALKAEEALRAQGICATVIDLFTWKPLDTACIVQAAQRCGAVVTAENHQIGCGLGAAVARTLCLHTPVPMEQVGICERFGQVGAQSFLCEEYGLDAAHIVEAAKRAIARKG